MLDSSQTQHTVRWWRQILSYDSAWRWIRPSRPDSKYHQRAAGVLYWKKKIHARPTRRGHLYIRFRGKHLCVAYNDASLCMTLYPWCRLSPKTLQLHMRRRSFVSQSGWSCVSDEELYGFTDNVNASIWCRSWEFAVDSGGGCSSVRKRV